MTVITALIIVSVLGVLLRRSNIISDKLISALFSYVYYVAVPAAVTFAIIDRPSLQFSKYSTFLLSNATIYMLVFVCLMILLRRRQIKSSVAGVIAFGSTSPNTVFLGFPLILALYGEVAFIYVVLLGTIMDAILNFVRILMIERYDKIKHHVKTHRRLLFFVQSLINPFSVSLAVGFVLIWLGVELPSAVMSTLKIAGLSSSYAAMFLLGATVATLKIIKDDHDEIFTILISKLFVLPLLVLTASLLLGLDTDARNVGVFVAALPSAVFNLILASNLKLDSRLAASAILSTTVVSLVTLPAWFFILKLLG